MYIDRHLAFNKPGKLFPKSNNDYMSATITSQGGFLASQGCPSRLRVHPVYSDLQNHHAEDYLQSV